MKLLIDAAQGGGYTFTTEMDDGSKLPYPRVIDNLPEALHYATVCADLVEKETGQRPPALVSASAIRVNKNRDLAARKLWNMPDWRAKMMIQH